MKTSDELHVLISNMTVEEKRFFRSSITGTRDNIYLKLFEAVEKQKEYDEEKIKKKLKISGKALGNAKYYLFRLIIKCLRRKHEDHLASFRTRKLLDEIEVLFVKGLHDQALKAIDRVRKLSGKGQNQLELARALQYETTIMTQRLSGLKLVHYFEGAHRELSSIFRNSFQVCDLHLIQQKLIYLSNEFGFNRSRPDEQELEKLEALPSLQNEPQEDEFNVLILFHTCLAIIAKLKFDHEKEALHFRVVLEKMQKYLLQQNQLHVIITARFNYCLALIFSGKYDLAEREITELRKMDTDAPFTREKIRRHSLTLNSSLYNFAQKQQHISQLEHELAETENMLATYPKDLAYILYHISVLHFRNKDYKKSKHYLNRLFDLGDEIPSVVLSNARILMLMVHEEQRESSLLLSRLASAKRAQKKEKGHYRTEVQALEVFARLASGKEKRETVFKTNIPSYEKLLRDPFERNGTRFLDFLGWMKEKL